MAETIHRTSEGPMTFDQIVTALEERFGELTPTEKARLQHTLNIIEKGKEGS